MASLVSEWEVRSLPGCPPSSDSRNALWLSDSTAPPATSSLRTSTSPPPSNLVSPRSVAEKGKGATWVSVRPKLRGALSTEL